MVMVGLKTGIPDITYEKAAELTQDFISQYGTDALEAKLTDAFVDAGLSDRAEVAKQRELIERLKAAQIELIEAAVLEKEEEVKKLKDKVSGILGMLGGGESTGSGEASVTGGGTVDSEAPLENPTQMVN